MTDPVLIVDDEALLRASLSELLEGWGYACVSCAGAEEALDLVARRRFSLAIIDIRMPGTGGIDLLSRLRTTASELPILMMTGYPSVEVAVAAMRIGAADFFTKPLDLGRLREDLTRYASLGAPSRQPASRRLEGSSPAMLELLATIERVAPTDAPVIVYGESGTGKELVAEALHALSRRASKPLLRQNCAAIPDQLLESELFGHEKGAYTGAETRKPGLLEEARGGSVFLDEIVDMDPRLQAKLLRVLQDGDYRTLGGTKPLKADVRIIAATHRNLEAAIAAGSFREDLYYRLSVICLRVPALRERPMDIVFLATRFASEFAMRYGKDLPSIGEDVAAILKAQPWPGNVRELRNCMERSVIFCDGDRIGPEHLPAQYLEGASLPAPETLAGRGSPPLADAHDELDRGLVLEALRRSGGNRTKAAELLGIHRRTLYYKLERLGLVPDGDAGLS